MPNTLLSPQGRLQPRPFVKAMCVLGLFFALMSLMPMVHPIMGNFIIFIALLLLVYPTLTLFIKRAHDAGKAGWLSIPAFLSLSIIYIFLSGIIGSFIGHDEAVALRAAMETIQGSTDLTEIMGVMDEYGQPFYSKIGIPNAVVSFISFPLCAVFMNAIWGRDPSANKYGPAG